MQRSYGGFITHAAVAQSLGSLLQLSSDPYAALGKTLNIVGLWHFFLC